MGTLIPKIVFYNNLKLINARDQLLLPPFYPCKCKKKPFFDPQEHLEKFLFNPLSLTAKMYTCSWIMAIFVEKNYLHPSLPLKCKKVVFIPKGHIKRVNGRFSKKNKQITSALEWLQISNHFWIKNIRVTKINSDCG